MSHSQNSLSTFNMKTVSYNASKYLYQSSKRILCLFINLNIIGTDKSEL